MSSVSFSFLSAIIEFNKDQMYGIRVCQCPKKVDIENREEKG